ncbi:hypothetical protein MP228_002458 [Amoeboaphelidium protococcarum]|nr:hypothetical protein MP228_002458 [Amoeboaphelidium protococcarum]
MTSLVETSSQSFIFSGSRQASGYVSKIQLFHAGLEQLTVAFKLKTNAPSKYSVRPVYGIIQPLSRIDVYVKCDGEIDESDKFLLQLVRLTALEDGQSAEFWKTVPRSRIEQRLLDCQLNIRPRSGMNDVGSIASISDVPPERILVAKNEKSGVTFAALIVFSLPILLSLAVVFLPQEIRDETMKHSRQLFDQFLNKTDDAIAYLRLMTRQQ